MTTSATPTIEHPGVVRRPASSLIPADLSAAANDLAAADDSLFARAFFAEMARPS